MLVSKRILLLFLSFFLIGCSHINHEADVVSVDRGLSPTAKALQTTRYGLLQNKNALRIALLKIGLYENKEHQVNSDAIVLDTGLLEFLGRADYSKKTGPQGWQPMALARLHGQLVPEFYQLLGVATEKSLRLYFICEYRVSCDLIRQNLSRKQLSHVKFLKNSDTKKLSVIKPRLVLASSAQRFSKLEDKSPLWRGWKKKWILLNKVDYDNRIKPDDLARVVPTINEF